jgi:hypothetical protein
MATSTTAGRARLATDSLGTLHYVGVVLAVLSGVVHLVVGVMFFPGLQPVSFLLAGLGFFGGVALLLVGYRRRLLYAVGIPFTGVQIVLWYYLNYLTTGASVTTASPVEVIDKVAQAALVVVLAVLLRRSA